MRTIDADALIELFETKYRSKDYEIPIYKIIRMIKTAPTVETKNYNTFMSTATAAIYPKDWQNLMADSRWTYGD